MGRSSRFSAGGLWAGVHVDLKVRRWLFLVWLAIQAVGCGWQASSARPAVQASLRVQGHTLFIHAAAQHFDMREGHFHVQIDGGPVIMFTGPDWAVGGLPSGRHTVVVQLALNDALHTVIAESRQEVDVP